MTLQSPTSEAPILTGMPAVEAGHRKGPVKHEPIDRATWFNMVQSYQHADTKKSVWQIVNSFVPFLALWYLMYLSLDYSYLLTLLLAVPAAGLVMRIFIIQHDCGHGSFLNSKKWQDIVGSICGVFTLTPYYYWRKTHAIHHANSGKLGDYRGVGEVYTMTVEEYKSKSWRERMMYRLYRNPFVLFAIVPTFLFVVMYRFSHPFQSNKWHRERASVFWTNVALVVVVAVMAWLIGLQAFLLIQMPIIIIVSTIGTWFFYVQHQFEDTYWEHVGDWEYSEAALRGSSYYKMPKVLQWFSGNIGFHHIHHLSPKIPNYLLQKAHEENPLLQEVTELTIRSSFESVALNLWDEKQDRLISFAEANAR